ncbi:MAG: hypothetical protein [Olavius algarvensis spirochete endosymbiont]|nr:MAG: hypothetical protein [Olavius algarvensis spirochete endosymbiont]
MRGAVLGNKMMRLEQGHMRLSGLCYWKDGRFDSFTKA